jgi:NADPH2:quinone reductase
MKAVRIHTFGDADSLVLDDVPVPEPRAGEVRVMIAAAGVNFVDVYERKGQYPQLLPALAGKEGAGTVEAVGPEVTEPRVGDRVAFGGNSGGYAESVLVPAWKAAPVPAGLDFPRAAAAMVQGLTAHYLCRSTFPLRPGQTALVHAAAGGVGSLVVQTAKMCGARVIATVSTPEKAEIARAAGADEVILYSTEDFLARTRELTGGKGVDVVYDSVGLDTFLKSLDCCRPRGMVALYGQASGPVAPLDPQVLSRKGSLFLSRPTLKDYMADRAELLERTREVFGWIIEGKLTIRIDRTFPLSRAADAHRYLEARQSRGKILLEPEEAK